MKCPLPPLVSWWGGSDESLRPIQTVAASPSPYLDPFFGAHPPLRIKPSSSLLINQLSNQPPLNPPDYPEKWLLFSICSLSPTPPPKDVMYAQIFYSSEASLVYSVHTLKFKTNKYVFKSTL